MASDDITTLVALNARRLRYNMPKDKIY